MKSKQFIKLSIIILGVIFLLSWLTIEMFANKNKNTVLNVDGEILGFDLLDHPDTFDYDDSGDPEPYDSSEDI
jgi:hypothetical protein